MNNQLSFRRLIDHLGYPEIQYNQIVGLSFSDKVNLIREKRFDKIGTNEVTSEMAEETFLILMDKYRAVGNRNIYGNNCAVFSPPSGFRYNAEVSNTYFHMYDGVLDASKALNLLSAFAEASLDYAIKSGKKYVCMDR